MRKTMDDVWCFETADQEFALDMISLTYECAVKGGKGSVRSRNELKELYNEPWDYLKKIMETEGSAYYMWHIDAANNYIKKYMVKIETVVVYE